MRAKTPRPTFASRLKVRKKLLAAAAVMPAADLARPVRPGFVTVWFEGEEATAALMAERLVYTLEIWAAAIGGQPPPDPSIASSGPDLVERFDSAGRTFGRLVSAIRERDAWNDAFVDALCEPPQSFTYGGVLAHILEFGAIRRHALQGVLRELGAGLPSSGDPIEWEARDRPAGAGALSSPNRSREW